MAEAAPLHLAASIGIDWADQKHDVSLQETGGTKVEHHLLRHTPEDIAEWIGTLRRRFNGQQVGVAIETSRGPLVHALLDYDFIVLYSVNPRSLSRFRDALYPSGAKDDIPDADLLLELLTKHRDRLRPWLPDEESTRALRRLVQSRRSTVDMRTQLAQQLRAALKDYFPQALSWVGDDLASPLACDFLLQWPTLEAVQRARPKTIRNFYYAGNSRSTELIEQRVEEMQNATPLTSDRAIIDTSVLLVQTLARQLKALGPSIKRFNEEIEKRFTKHESAPLFSSLPGSGVALAPRLLALFGSKRDRYEKALDLQLLTGIAPVTERSGKQHWVHWRWRASTFQRQTVHEFAHHSIQHSRWAKAYYDLQRDRGKKHHVAVRALAYKWLRIIWRCWQDGTVYDEARYIEALIKRGSPVAARLTAAAPA
jgi:transposase